MKKLFFGFSIASILICLSLGINVSVFAQDDEFTLEEITVTAQKREENQQKVPIAMEVLSGEDFKELGRNDIDQILTNVSSALINKASDGLRVSIRGVSDDNSVFFGVQASTPTVAVNKDGIYTNRKDSGQGLFDVERVEVLFGPQSTLYASASPGGIVNIVTASPKLEKYEASGSIEYGNYDLLHTDGSINAPVSDSVALRAAFTTSVRDGYLTNGGDDEDSKSARIRALYKPNDKISFLATGEIQRSNSQGIIGVEEFEKEGDVANPWTAETTDPTPPTSKIQKRIYANVDWDLGFGTLSMLPSYMTRTHNSTSTSTRTGTAVTTLRENSGFEKGIETRIASSEDFFFEWIAGFNWYESEDKTLDNADDGSWGDRRSLQEMTTVYGNITYPLTEAFRTTVGIRKTIDENQSYSEQWPNRNNPDSSEPWLVVIDMEYDSPDYKLGVEYDFSENTLVYADWSTSYRTQGMAWDSSGTPFPSEEFTSYTLGSKNRFFDNKLQLNVSAFYYEYENYLAVGGVTTLDQKDLNGDGDFNDEQLYDPDSGQTRNETLAIPDENAKTVGDANVMGVDIQSTTIFTSKDILTVSISYLKSEFTDLFFDYMDSTNALGIPDLDYEGKGMTFSPEWTINLNYSHRFDLPNGGRLTARIDTRYQSEYFLTWSEKSLNIDRVTWLPVVTDLDEIRTQEAHHISNFSAVYSHPDGNWTLSGYVKNLEDYAVKRSWLGESLVIGPPRTYGVIFSVKY